MSPSLIQSWSVRSRSNGPTEIVDGPGPRSRRSSSGQVRPQQRNGGGNKEHHAARSLGAEELLRAAERALCERDEGIEGHPQSKTNGRSARRLEVELRGGCTWPSVDRRQRAVVLVAEVEAARRRRACRRAMTSIAIERLRVEEHLGRLDLRVELLPADAFGDRRAGEPARLDRLDAEAHGFGVALALASRTCRCRSATAGCGCAARRRRKSPSTCAGRALPRAGRVADISSTSCTTSNCDALAALGAEEAEVHAQHRVADGRAVDGRALLVPRR